MPEKERGDTVVIHVFETEDERQQFVEELKLDSRPEVEPHRAPSRPSPSAKPSRSRFDAVGAMEDWVAPMRRMERMMKPFESIAGQFAHLSAIRGIGKPNVYDSGVHKLFDLVRPSVLDFGPGKLLVDLNGVQAAKMAMGIAGTSFQETMSSALLKSLSAAHLASPTLAATRQADFLTRSLLGFVPPAVLLGDLLPKHVSVVHNVLGYLGLGNRGEHVGWSATLATRRLALAGLAAEVAKPFQPAFTLSSLLEEHIGAATGVADLLRGYPGTNEYREIFDDLAAATDAVVAGDEDARKRLSEFGAKLREAIARASSSPILSLVALLFTFISHSMSLEKPEWAEDMAARQRRILENQTDLRNAVRSTAEAAAKAPVQSAERDAQLDDDLQALADSIAAQNVRTLATRAHLHAKPSGGSNVLLNLEPGDSVIVLRIQKRWALVATDLRGVPRIGWIPKKALKRR